MDNNISLEDFKNIFEDVVSPLFSNPVLFRDLPHTLKRIRKILSYCVPHKTAPRGYMVVRVYQELVKTATDAQINLAVKLGWIWQIVQTHLALLDEYVDNDEIRWNVKTWQVLTGKKRIAANDTLLVQHVAFKLLQIHYAESTVYSDILSYFQEVISSYSFAQAEEFEMSMENNPNFENCNLESCKKLIGHMSTRSTFGGQFHLAMILAGVSKNALIWQQIDTISISMALLFTLSNDYADSFSGKHAQSNDIKQGKCKFLVLLAKEVCLAGQWQQILSAYGNDKQTNVDKVKGIFVTLGIPEKALQMIHNMKQEVVQEIETFKETDYPNIALLMLAVLDAFVK